MIVYGSVILQDKQSVTESTSPKKVATVELKV